MKELDKELPAYTVDDEPQAVWDMTKYLRRLIIEAPYIYARVTNPGGSILLRATSEPDKIAYGTQIGNDAHLDLIDASVVMNRDFSKGERDEIVRWSQGFTSQQAAEYNGVKSGAVMRKRRERLITKLETRMNGLGPQPRGTGGRDTERGGVGNEPASSGNTGQEAAAPSSEAGDTAERNRGKAA